MKTSSAKAKGRRACKAVKDWILAAFPELKDHDIIIASAGQTGEDLLFSPKARELFPVSFEVKNQEHLNIWKTHKQAESNAEDYLPIVAFTRNRSPVYISMEIGDFFKLIKGNIVKD